MANHTYSKGLLYKKTLNSSGEVTGSVPLLLKTLGSLVIMSDGTDAETAISTAISNMVTPDETTIVTGQDGITISVKKSTSAEIDEILGDVPTSHTWEGYYTKSETEALIDVVDDKISQSGIETALGYTPIPTTAKGSNNGVAELDATGKVPASQLPSYVDDVIESATYAALPETGESGKIYVTLNDDKTYRWSGSAYVEISASLALGETSSTAYRGDRGKTAYDHSQTAHARVDATNAAIVSGKLNINGSATNIGDFKAVSTAASQGLTDTEKSNALANIGAVPNSDLIGIVDNGAKNYIDIPDTTVTSGAYTDWGSFDVPAGDYEFAFNTTTTGIGVAIQLHDDSGNETGYKAITNTVSGQNHASVTVTAGTVKVRLYINAAATVTNVMLTPKSQFDISPTYEPYALGNQYLTSELIELCDSGAKNLLTINQAATSTSAGNRVFMEDNMSLPAGTYVFSLTENASSVPSSGNVIQFSLTYSDSTTETLPFITTKAKTRLVVTYTFTKQVKSIGIYAGYAGCSLIDIMCCTKAAFGVSTKFVPYTKSNSQLTTELGSVKTVLEAIL